jgi:hypothetical protein
MTKPVKSRIEIPQRSSTDLIHANPLSCRSIVGGSECNSIGLELVPILERHRLLRRQPCADLIYQPFQIRETSRQMSPLREQRCSFADHLESRASCRLISPDAQDRRKISLSVLESQSEAVFGEGASARCSTTTRRLTSPR